MISKEHIQQLADNHLKGTNIFVTGIKISSDNKINVFIDGDEGVFDEEVGEGALVGIGRLLLLLATELDLGAGGEARFDDNASDLGIEIGGNANDGGVAV